MDKLKHTLNQFFKFGAVGAFNTILTLLIQWLFLAIGFHYLVGSIVSFVITVILAYILNNIFSFHDNKSAINWSFKSFLKVVSSYSITGLIIANIGLWFWNDILFVNPNISPVLNLFITIPINFILNKFWAYK